MPRLFVEQLTVIDFSYLDANRGLVGESWIVDLELGGALDEQGMVFDFGPVKKQVKAAIDEFVDHRLLIPSDSPGLQELETGDRFRLRFTLNDGAEIVFSSPPSGGRLVPGEIITATSVEALLVRELSRLMPDNVRDVSVRLRPEQIDGAYYQYSHGLKKHAGQCQRIAHGHRSRIHVLQEGARRADLELNWAERWRDVYLGSREDLVAREERHGEEYLCFAYRAREGEFELWLPARRCYVLETDSTVEHIAVHIAGVLAREVGGEGLEVRAFEGVGKGAVAAARP